LKRIRIINISLDIPVGRYRTDRCGDQELNDLSPSGKTEAGLPKEEPVKEGLNSLKRRSSI
jgi:23S rRNA pseudouridine2604 synthase